jgi:hypothetical protein
MSPARVNSGQAGAKGNQMGDVILFRLRKRPGSSRSTEGEERTGQVLFFTGVRYQRMSETAHEETGGRRPSSQGGEGGKRKRKRG